MRYALKVNVMSIAGSRIFFSTFDCSKEVVYLARIGRPHMHHSVSAMHFLSKNLMSVLARTLVLVSEQLL